MHFVTSFEKRDRPPDRRNRNLMRWISHHACGGPHIRSMSLSSARTVSIHGNQGAVKCDVKKAGWHTCQLGRAHHFLILTADSIFLCHRPWIFGAGQRRWSPATRCRCVGRKGHFHRRSVKAASMSCARPGAMEGVPHIAEPDNRPPLR